MGLAALHQSQNSHAECGRYLEGLSPGLPRLRYRQIRQLVHIARAILPIAKLPVAMLFERRRFVGFCALAFLQLPLQMSQALPVVYGDSGCKQSFAIVLTKI